MLLTGAGPTFRFVWLKRHLNVSIPAQIDTRQPAQEILPTVS